MPNIRLSSPPVSCRIFGPWPAVLSVLVLSLAGALPAPASAQDFEPVDLEQIERLLQGLELPPADADDPEGARQAPGAGEQGPPVPAAVPLSGVGHDQGGDPAAVDLENLTALERALLLRLAESDDSTPGRLSRVWRGLQRPWVHVAGSLIGTCLRRTYASSVLFPGAGVFQPSALGLDRLSDNPMPSYGGDAALSAREIQAPCFVGGWEASVDVPVFRSLELGVGVRSYRAVHDVEVSGHAPSLLVWDAVVPFDGLAELVSLEELALLRVGWRFKIGRSDVSLVAAPGLARLSLGVVSDARGVFYSLGASPLYPVGDAGDGAPAGPSFVIADHRRTRFVAEFGGGFTRWLRGPIGVGVEVRYLRSLGSRTLRESASAIGPSGAMVDWRYAPDQWSASTGIRARF